MYHRYLCVHSSLSLSLSSLSSLLSSHLLSSPKPKKGGGEFVCECVSQPTPEFPFPEVPHQHTHITHAHKVSLFCLYLLTFFFPQIIQTQVKDNQDGTYSVLFSLPHTGSFLFLIVVLFFLFVLSFSSLSLTHTGRYRLAVSAIRPPLPPDPLLSSSSSSPLPPLVCCCCCCCCLFVIFPSLILFPLSLSFSFSLSLSLSLSLFLSLFLFLSFSLSLSLSLSVCVCIRILPLNNNHR